MSNVKRYDKAIIGDETDMLESDICDYVLYSDYEKLEAELKWLQDTVNKYTVPGLSDTQDSVVEHIKELEAKLQKAISFINIISIRELDTQNVLKREILLKEIEAVD